MQTTSVESGTTINRGGARGNRLGLLLKQYYDAPNEFGDDESKTNEYSLVRLQKLKTEPLMARAVESLRSYKEAESELRMLLYNNCDKLLEAVQVVCDIRECSGGLVTEADQLTSVVGRVKSGASEGVMGQFQTVLARQDLINQIEQLTQLPVWLEKADEEVDEKLKMYIRFSSELASTTSHLPVIVTVFEKSKRVVEDRLVPALMNEAALGGGLSTTRLNLLLELFPAGHERHSEILLQFIQFEVVGFDELLSKRAKAFVSKIGVPTRTECLSTFNGIITALFLTQDTGVAELIEKVRDDLLPRASKSVLLSLIHSHEPDATLESSCEFIQNAISAHLRIPMVSRLAVAEFTRVAILNWIEARFVAASKTCVSEDLVALLAASAYGACCDVIHTRCCTVVVDVHQFLSQAEFVDDPSGFAPDVLLLVRRYYELVTLPVTLAGTVSGEDQFAILLKLMKMNKFLFNRKTVDRSVKAVIDIFDQDDDDDVGGTGGSEIESVVPIATFQLIKLMGGWASNDTGRLEKVIEQGLANVLDSAATPAAGGGGSGRFKSAAEELDLAEIVHSRKLWFPVQPQVDARTLDNLPGLELGVLIVGCLFIKSAGEAGTTTEGVLELVKKHVGAVQHSEYVQTVNAMLRDSTHTHPS